MDLVLFNAHDIILLVAVYECLLLAFLFAVARNHLISTRIFIIGFLLFSAAVPLDIIIQFGAAFRDFATHHLPNWFYAFEVGYWLQGPFLLWYFRSLRHPDFRLSWSDVIYILPFILYFSHQLLVYHSLSSEVKESMQVTYSMSNESYTILFIVVGREALRAYFAVLCIMELKAGLAGCRDTGAGGLTRAGPVVGLRLLATGFLVISSVGVLVSVGVLLNVARDFSFPASALGLVSNYILCFYLGAIIIYICLHGFPALRLDKASAAKSVARRAQVNPKDLRRLEELMETQKPFLDPLLTREDLAKQLNIPPRLLSKVINMGFNCNFFTYVNRYRVDRAKKLLLDADRAQDTVLDIMHDVGFQNKATFNSMFKKFEGMTPTEYKKTYLAEKSDGFSGRTELAV